MGSFVANPRVTLNIVPRDQRLGLEDQRVLIVGQKLSGTAAAGLNRDVPRTDAEINELFGARSHLSLMCRAFRRVNKVTNLDVIALADNAGGTAGTAVIVGSGTATKAKTVYVSVVSATHNRYEVDVVIGETPATFMAKLAALIDEDTEAPFTYATSGTPVTTVTFTAANKGTLCNGWLLSVLDTYDRPANVPGLTFTLTGWTGGATNPSLSGLFDEVENTRYQGVVYPEAYTRSTLVNWIDARKNLDNNILDGRAFIYSVEAYADVKTSAISYNSSEVVVMTNEKNDLSYWKGPHIPEAPDAIAAKAAAARARRFEDGFSISDLVVTNEPRDQFGGMSKNSLPYFNTPILEVRQPLTGSGYTYEEQVELEGDGVTVIGYNRTNNAVIMGQVVTTWNNDAAGNLDDTWKWLEWRDTHGAIREYFVTNLRREFSQYRMTAGTAVPGYAIVDEAGVRAFLYELFERLAAEVLTQAGRDARRYFEDNLVVTMRPDLRRVEVAADVPMVSQLGEIIGSVKFSFSPGTV